MRQPKRSTRTVAARPALLLVDVINDLSFPEAGQLLRFARPMTRRIARLKERCRRRGIPCIYVNDNFGRWRSDFRAVVEHCRSKKSRGREMADALAPDEEDYFVLKPLHSGFFSTTLEVLLDHLQVNTLILTGVAGDWLGPFWRKKIVWEQAKWLISKRPNIEGFTSNVVPGTCAEIRENGRAMPLPIR